MSSTANDLSRLSWTTIFGGISQPDIGLLFTQLATSASYQQFSSLVAQAQGSTGLIQFLLLDLDHALTLDPQAQDRAGRRLVRLMAGHPVTMGEMTRYVSDAGSYPPVTILIEQLPGTRVAYDTVVSEMACTTMRPPGADSEPAGCQPAGR